MWTAKSVRLYMNFQMAFNSQHPLFILIKFENFVLLQTVNNLYLLCVPEINIYTCYGKRYLMEHIILKIYIQVN